MIRYLIVITTSCMAAVMLHAQSEGMMLFSERIDMHRRIPEERAEMKDMIPQYRSSKYELHFTESVSMYKAAPQGEDADVVGAQGGPQFRMRTAPPRRQIYKNLSEDKMVDEREFMTKLFLIKGQAAPFAWKIGNGQKQILGYLCMEATSKDSVNAFTAWFTPQIQISNGPDEYGGLPGMILEVDINRGERVITATAITEHVVDPALLKEPTKGKQVTREEYREIVREKMQEMQGQQSGPGFFIRMQ